MKFSKRIFFIYILILNFILVLGLFAYLFKIENNINDYSKYKTYITNLTFIEKEFKHFFLKKDQFINFDEIVSETRKFEQNLDSLYKSNIEEDFGNILVRNLNTVSKAYDNKLSLIEDYKSNQASILNSIHYILDLNKEIKDNKKYSNDISNKIDRIVFLILNNFIHIEDDFTQVLKKLSDFEQNHRISNDTKIEIFLFTCK